MTTLDEALLVAMREARRHHLEGWLALLAAHKSHTGFEVQTWPYSLEYGFTCRCTGVEQEHRIRVHDLRTALPEAREAVFRLFRHHMHAGDKGRKRQRSKALGRSRALLHRHLTREQRWSMRAGRSFTVTAAGRDYEITEGSCNNVLTQWRGQTISLCLIAAKDHDIPYFDTMLMQKVILETDPEGFLAKAAAGNRDTRQLYVSAKFLADGSEPVVAWEPERERVRVPDEVLDNPIEYLQERVRVETRQQ